MWSSEGSWGLLGRLGFSGGPERLHRGFMGSPGTLGRVSGGLERLLRGFMGSCGTLGSVSGGPQRPRKLAEALV